MVGKPADLFYPDDAVAAGKPATIRAEAVTRGKIEMDDWRVRKDGSEFLAHIAITALKNLDGTVRGFAIVVRDITDQRAAESALRNSETHLRSILSTVPDAMIVIDERGKMLYFNTAAERLSGYRVAKGLGANLSRLKRATA